MTEKATKVTIISEKLIQADIVRIIEDAGASGYSVFEGGGKGQHGLRPTARPKVVNDFGIVKIEAVVADRSVADTIAEKVAATYFDNYSGIVYLEEVEILRPKKF